MQAPVSKSQFKAKALEYFRHVESTGNPMVVTDHGQPRLEVRPYRVPNRHPLDVLRGSVMYYKDPTAPVGDDEWGALR
jgi:hypothetical protein